MGVRGRFNKEFRRSAVELAGRMGVPAAAQDLGVSVGALYRWCRDERMRGPSGVLPSELEKENRKLQKELHALKRIIDVLKKFSRDHKSH